ncbi:unnamed protein product, partial [Amoebophrya sp. A25]
SSSSHKKALISAKILKQLMKRTAKKKSHKKKKGKSSSSSNKDNNMSKIPPHKSSALSFGRYLALAAKKYHASKVLDCIEGKIEVADILQKYTEIKERKEVTCIRSHKDKLTKIIYLYRSENESEEMQRTDLEGTKQGRNERP